MHLSVFNWGVGERELQNKACLNQTETSSFSGKSSHRYDPAKNVTMNDTDIKNLSYELNTLRETHPDYQQLGRGYPLFQINI